MAWWTEAGAGGGTEGISGGSKQPLWHRVEEKNPNLGTPLLKGFWSLNHDLPSCYLTLFLLPFTPAVKEMVIIWKNESKSWIHHPRWGKLQGLNRILGKQESPFLPYLHNVQRIYMIKILNTISEHHLPTWMTRKGRHRDWRTIWLKWLNFKSPNNTP